MKRDEQLELFIEKNTEESIKDYLNKIHDNLKDLNSREAKYAFWFILVLFLYVFLCSVKIDSFQLGYISVNDSSIILTILPTLYAYFLFNIRVIQSQKRDSEYVLARLAEHLYFPYKDERGKEISLIIRVFFPYSFTNSLNKIISKKREKFETSIEPILLFPLMVIFLLLPYGVIIYMIIDLVRFHLENMFGIISLCITIYLTLLLTYYHILHFEKSER